MMLYLYNDEQRSFPEYVDFYIKEIVSKPLRSEDQLPLCNWRDFMEYLYEGYCPSFLPSNYKFPSCVETAFDRDGTTNKRMFKKWCKKVFEQYGEPEKACKIVQAAWEEWERIDKEYLEEDQ